MAEQLTKTQIEERKAEHAVAFSRVAMSDDVKEVQANLDFLNDDGWEITKTPRDEELSAVVNGDRVQQ